LALGKAGAKYQSRVAAGQDLYAARRVKYSGDFDAEDAMLVNQDSDPKQCAETLPNRPAELERTNKAGTVAKAERSLTGLVRRNTQWLRDTHAYWLAAAEDSVTNEHRRFCLQCARRFASLILANEDCMRRLELQRPQLGR
jgi:hypothetical protein